MNRYSLEVKDCVNSNIEVIKFGDGKPEIVITGGIHGGETTGIYSAKRLVDYLLNNGLKKGTVKVLSVCNPTAFRRLERTSPYDNVDLNRIFPGNTSGSITQRVAAAIWEETQTADFIVDLHCCGVHGSSYTLATWQNNEQAKELAMSLDIPIIVQSGGARGQLFVETCEQGRPAVIIELPGGGQGGVICQEAGDRAYNALLNLLRKKDMIKGEYVEPTPILSDKLIPLRASTESLFIPKTKAGQLVSKGDILATLDGKDMVSPVNGTVISLRPMGYVFIGSYLGSVSPHIK